MEKIAKGKGKKRNNKTNKRIRIAKSVDYIDDIEKRRKL